MYKYTQPPPYAYVCVLYITTSMMMTTRIYQHHNTYTTSTTNNIPQKTEHRQKISETHRSRLGGVGGRVIISLRYLFFRLPLATAQHTYTYISIL